MRVNPESTYIAFAGTKKIGKGQAVDVAKKVKRFLIKSPDADVLIFDTETSTQAEFNFRGSEAAVINRLISELAKEKKPTGPGRPKLGVVSREIGLLPRQWDWLALQPGGASATLRKLVDEARKRSTQQDRARLSQEVTYKFMHAIAGDFPLYEEALRALYAKKKSLFETLIASWPKDIRDHLATLSEAAFS